MEPSLIGLAVAGVLMVVGRAFGSAVTVGLFAALPFQATAFATLSALGGSSAPVATLFALMFVGGCLRRRNLVRDISGVMREHWSGWVILGLTAYVVLGAYLLPRLFQGATSAFIPLQGLIFEVPLSPVSGNVAQSCYFVLDGILFLLLSAHLRRAEAWPHVLTGFFALVVLHASAGVVNVIGNATNLGDVLLPIRTASYAMLGDHQVGGLWRIAGACPEASAFAVLALSCFAFCFAYWRRTGSPAALKWGSAHLILLLLSTSSTAYVGLGVLAATFGLSTAITITTGHLSRRDIELLAFCGLGVALVLTAMLFVPPVVKGFTDLVDNMVFKKHLSSSGQERSYWNSQSLQAFFDTNWLGIGLGSSRASSWAVAVLSQTGFVGAVGFIILLGAVWHAPNSMLTTAASLQGEHLRNIAFGVRAAVMANLLGASISAGNADPGLLVFAGCAICLSAPAAAARITNTGASGDFVVIGLPGRVTNARPAAAI